MLSRRSFVVSLGLMVACAKGKEATTRAPEEEAVDRAARVEQGLLPAVQVEGEEARRSLSDRMRELKIPAISVAVFADHRLLWARAYGVADVETGAGVGPETLFQAGSISKPVNALGVLGAVAEGALALDRPINESLTGWKLPDNALTRATPVTLRQLLSHTAGTTVHGFPGYAPGEPVPSVPQVLDGAAPANTPPVRVDLAPGTGYRYSGGGTTISQLALSERLGQPYPALMAARVLGPLGMSHSTYEQPLPASRLSQAAAGHDSEGRAIAGKRHTYPEMAAAGLWTTPSDLARFMIEVGLARAGRSRRVSQEVALQMTTKVADVPDSPGVAIGLGLFLRERNGARLYGHSGADAGFQAFASASLDGGYGVVVMANSDNGFRIFDEIERAVYAEYGWPGADPRYVRVALTPELRAGLVGRYLDGRMPVEIAVEGEALVMRAPFGEGSGLVPIGPATVVVRESAESLTRQADGSLAVSHQGHPSRVLTRMAADAKHPLLELEAGRFESAVASWREQAREDPKAAAEQEAFVNRYAYRVLAREPARAVELLRLVAEVFPDSSNAHDSLAEAYVAVKDTARAIAAYERSLATLAADPRMPAEIKPARRGHAEAELARLRGAGTKPP